MKSLLAPLLLCFCLHSTHAQAPAERASSQQYGWFHSLEWAKTQHLASPGWRLQKTGTTAGGWEYALFSDLNYTQAVTYRFWQGAIGAVDYTFFYGNPEGKEWTTAKFEPVGPNEWKDAKNNATIKRHYDGTLTVYEVIYTPLTAEK